MKRDFNKWLASLGPAAPVKTLTELREWNTAHEKMGAIKYGQSQLDAADKIDLEKDRAKYEEDRARDIRLGGTTGIDAALKANTLDALLFPGSSSAGIASKPGYPTVIVPFGMVPNTPGNLAAGGGRGRGEPRAGSSRHSARRRQPRRDGAADYSRAERSRWTRSNAGAISARLRAQAAALRGRVHRHRLQRADAAPARLRVRAGDEETDAAARPAVTAHPPCSPDRVHSVFPEDSVFCHDRQALSPGLRDDEAVERIAMMERQRLNGRGMRPVDGENAEAVAYLPRYVFWGWRGQAQPSQTCFDGELPHARRAEVPLLAPVDGRARRPAQTAVAGHVPEERMRVDEQLHAV